ncbi:hypothetical protein BDB00DRAFT_848124 [Zychaea mexicana]|uniref:uncharacterized protein n=1 Tax=Zychaea mexicana TaxID=64656 RepID=UPI0022FDB4A4|nr:uncharacterized protein BDB00DRAFT_848124 [Zychaea mexicana]KAI9488462.1 hypothetical protein BDB00DRAFT_848124 [Zychaea mexicana]
MHRSTQLLYFFLGLLVSCCFVAVGVRAIETTSLPGTPVSPSGVVCIQVVCPDPGVDGSATCPERCNGNCNIIQNACCPQNSVAVCADEAGASSGAGQPQASSTTSGPVPTAVSSSSSSHIVASSSPSSSLPASSASPPPAETTDSTSSTEETPEGSSDSLKLPFFVLPLFMILVTKLLLL